MSESAKHVKKVYHVFYWVILCEAPPQNCKIRRNLEASYITLLKPTLHEQKDFKTLTVFRNCIT